MSASEISEINDMALFDRLFGAGRHTIVIDGLFLKGSVLIGGDAVAVIGTRQHAAVDAPLALAIGGAVLDVVAADQAGGTAPRAIVFLVDTQGQALARRDELLGLNGYFAHVAQCVDLARRSGHRIVTVIDGEAVSGGFLAFGLLADRICALPGAQVRVMDLRAMARVTKIPLERLSELAKASPVFAPGAENYWRMGAIHEIWRDDESWSERLAQALSAAGSESASGDTRAELGLQRGGRQLAAGIAQRMVAA